MLGDGGLEELTSIGLSLRLLGADVAQPAVETTKKIKKI